MLPRLDAAVTPLSAADAAGAAPAFGDGRQAAFQRALQTLVGQQVQAEVLDKYSDGSFLVKVAENSVRMALPANVQVGAELPLTVIAAQPRPTFQLGNGPLPGNPAALVYTETPPASDGEGLYGPPLPAQDPQTAATGARPQTAASGQAAPAAGNAAASAVAAGDPAALATEAEAAGAGAATDKAAASALRTAGPPAATVSESTGGADLATELAAEPRAAASGRGTPAPGAAVNPGAAAVPPGAAGASAAAAAARGLPASAASSLAANASVTTAASAAGNGAALAAGLQASGVDLSRPQRLAATLLGKAPLTPAADLPALDPSAPAPTLSSTAKVLTSVLSAAQGSAATLIGKLPLFGDGPPATAQLAQRLHDTITQSGLFYESHVAEWVRGERSLPELLREPQMQRLAQGAEAAARAAAAGPDLSAAQMINQQLHAQEQSRVQWNGQAWPGQNMQWDIRREQRDGGEQGQGSGDGTPEAVWRSGVRFRFAMLGEVSATVTLVGDQVHIQMQTDSGGAASTLRAYAGQLEQAMEAAGAPLSSLTIRQDSEAGDA